MTLTDRVRDTISDTTLPVCFDELKRVHRIS